MSNEELEKLADLIAERLGKVIAENTQKKFMSREEYAKAHNLGVRTVDRMIKNGEIKVDRIRRKVRIPV